MSGRYGTFSLQNGQKGTPNLTSPYVFSLFAIVLVKQIFLKNKSSRAASGSQSEITPVCLCCKYVNSFTLWIVFADFE